MKQKIKVEKGNVQETLLLPLWGRAFETKKKSPRLIDAKAVEIMESFDYDFSEIEKTQVVSQHGWVARSLHTDRMAMEFIRKYPKATIVNIGCGMDTTFSRVDNGKITFYELDFPDVIELRKKFYKKSKRHISIASSFLDTSWFDKIKVEEALLCLAGGVLYYVSEKQIKSFFVAMADRFEESHFYFDSLSPMAMSIAKKQVLKKGGMGMAADAGWAVKNPKDLEKWDSRFTVMDALPMHTGVKRGLPLSAAFPLFMADTLGVCHMIHLKIN